MRNSCRTKDSSRVGHPYVMEGCYGLQGCKHMKTFSVCPGPFPLPHKLIPGIAAPCCCSFIHSASVQSGLQFLKRTFMFVGSKAFLQGESVSAHLCFSLSVSLYIYYTYICYSARVVFSTQAKTMLSIDGISCALFLFRHLKKEAWHLVWTWTIAMPPSLPPSLFFLALTLCALTWAFHAIPCVSCVHQTL